MQALDEEIYSNETLAEKFQVPASTVRMWRMKGTGPKGFRVGKHVRYRRSDVEAWINELAARTA